LDTNSFLFFFFLLEVLVGFIATNDVCCFLGSTESVVLPGDPDFLCDGEVDVRFSVTALEALTAVLLPDLVLPAASVSVPTSGSSTARGGVNMAVFLVAAAARRSLFSAFVNVFLIRLGAIFGFCFISFQINAAQIFGLILTHLDHTLVVELYCIVYILFHHVKTVP
jgi:hypothetical protein